MRGQLRTKSNDYALILLWPIVAPFLLLALKANLAFSVLIFFGIPSIYLSFKNTRIIKRAALFSLVCLPPLVVIDYVMEKTGGWHVINSVAGSFRLFGYSSVDNIIWAFSFVYFVVVFYETFLHDHVRPKIYYPNFRYFVALSLVLFSLFVYVYSTNPERLNIDHFYLKVGLIVTPLPIILTLLRLPKVYPKLLIAGLYFFFLSFGYEITALTLKLWNFPNAEQVIGHVTVGNISFPLEELFFWMVLSVMALLSYFEFFDDDRR